MSRRYGPYDPSYYNESNRGSRGQQKRHESDRGRRGQNEDQLQSKDSRYSLTDYSWPTNRDGALRNSATTIPLEVQTPFSSTSNTQRVPAPASPSYYAQYATPTVDRNYSRQESAAPPGNSAEHFPHATQRSQPESKYSDDAMYISKAKEMALKTQQMLSKFRGAKNPSDNIHMVNLQRNDDQQSNVVSAATDRIDERRPMTLENVNQLLYGNNYASIHPHLDTSRTYDNSVSTTAVDYMNLSQPKARQAVDESVYYRNELPDQYKKSAPHDIVASPNLVKSEKYMNEPRNVAPASPVENPNYDPTIENILKSIGFNFEFSHMKQAEAKERQRQLDLAAAEEARRAAVEDARRAAAEDSQRIAAEEVRRAAFEDARRAAAEESKRRAEAQNARQKSAETVRLAALEESTYLNSSQNLHDRMLNPNKYRRTPDTRTSVFADLRDTSRSPDPMNSEPPTQANVKKFYEDFSDSDNDFRDRTPLPNKAKKLKTDFPETVSVESPSSSNRPESSKDVSVSNENLSDWECEKNDSRHSADRKSRNKDVPRRQRSGSNRQGRSKGSSSSEPSSERYRRTSVPKNTKKNISGKKSNTKSKYRSDSSNERSSERDRPREKRRDPSNDRQKNKYSRPVAYSRKTNAISSTAVADNKQRRAAQKPLKKAPVVIVIDDDPQEERAKILRLKRELTTLEADYVQIMIKLRKWSKGDGQSDFAQNKKLLALNLGRQSNIKQQINLLTKRRRLMPDNLTPQDSSKFKKLQGETDDPETRNDELDSGDVSVDVTTRPIEGDKYKLKKMTVNYVYEDKGDHWCKSCNHVSTTIQFHLEHLHSLEHSKHIKKRTWSSLLAKAIEKQNAVAAPIRGVEFLMATQSFYCSLCEEFSSDEILAEAHLKTDAHNKKFQRFVDDNPQYERTYNLEKASRVCIKPDAGKDVNPVSKTVERKKSQDAEIVTVESLSAIQLPPATKPSQPSIVTTRQGQNTTSLSKSTASTSTGFNSLSSVLITMAPSIENKSSAVVNHLQPVKKILPFIGKLPNFRRTTQIRKGAMDAPLPPSQPPPLPPLPAEIEVRRRSSRELDELVAMAAAQSVQDQAASSLLEVSARNQHYSNVPFTLSSSNENSQIPPEMLIAHSNVSMSSYAEMQDDLEAKDSLDNFLSIGDSNTSGHKSLPWYSEINTTANTCVLNLPVDSIAKKRKLPRHFDTVADQQSKIAKSSQSLLDIPIPAATTSHSLLSTSTTGRSVHPPVTVIRAVKSSVATCQNMPPEMRQKFKLELNTGSIRSSSEDLHKNVYQQVINDDSEVGIIKHIVDNQIERKGGGEAGNEISSMLADVGTDMSSSVNNTTNLPDNSGLSTVVENQDLTISEMETSLTEEQVVHANNKHLKDDDGFDRALFEAKQKCYAIIAESNMDNVISNMDTVITNDLPVFCITDVNNKNAGTDLKMDSLDINIKSDVSLNKSESKIELDAFYSEIEKCESDSSNLITDAKQDSSKIMPASIISDSDLPSVISRTEIQSDCLNADDLKVSELNKVVSIEEELPVISENISGKNKFSLLEMLDNRQNSDGTNVNASKVTGKTLDVVVGLNTSAEPTDQNTLSSNPERNLKIEDDGAGDCIPLKTKDEFKLITPIQCKNTVLDKLIDSIVTTNGDESKVEEIRTTNQETVAGKTCNISVSDVLKTENDKFSCKIEESFPVTASVSASVEFSQIRDDRNNERRELAPGTEGKSLIAPVTEGNCLIAPITEGISLIPPVTEGNSLIAPVTKGNSLIASITEGNSLIPPVTEGNSLIPPVTEGNSLIASVTEGYSLTAPATEAKSFSNKANVMPMKYLKSDVVTTSTNTGTVMNSQNVECTVAGKIEASSVQLTTGDTLLLSCVSTNIGVVSDNLITTKVAVQMKEDISASSDLSHDLDWALRDKLA